MARVSFRLALACLVGILGAYSPSASATCPGSFSSSPALGNCTTPDGGYTVNCEEITVPDGCAGNPITLNITGGGQSDEINLVDTVSGYDMDCSNSTVHAQDGDDYIKGSPNATYQHDYLYGDENDDGIWGYEGNDYLNGGYGSDHIKGGAGADTIYGENGNDYLCGEADGDTLYGGDGDDRVYGGTGTDYNNGDGGVNVCENENITNCPLFTNSCGW